MEVGHKVNFILSMICRWKVSILVVMEVGHKVDPYNIAGPCMKFQSLLSWKLVIKREASKADCRPIAVSILVVMEVGHKEYWGGRTHEFVICFNPCCHGSWS